MIKIILLLMMLPGCADNTYREFRHEDNQEPGCSDAYGGKPGYCDARRHYGDFRK